MQNGSDQRLPILVVSSKIKSLVKSMGLNTSAEVITNLSEKVSKIVERAVGSAKQDGRKTLMARDLDNTQ